MKSFVRPTEDEIATAWKQGLFVFDTSFLLNLYRHPATARDDIFRILGRIKDRIWIPFLVALEYERNRLDVIASQRSKFRELQGILEKSNRDLRNKVNALGLKKRHSVLDADDLLDEIDTLTGGFLSNLSKLEAEQPDINDQDPLRDKLYQVIGSRVGSPPTKQWLEESHKEAEKRFANYVPPGFLDRDKERGSEPTKFQHGELLFDRRYSDFFIWKEVLERTNELSCRQLLMITDDRKGDWWRIKKSGANLRLGPRPELQEEIRSLASVDTFLMYTSEVFLQRSQDQLGLALSEDSFKQVEATLAEERRAHLWQEQQGLNTLAKMESLLPDVLPIWRSITPHILSIAQDTREATRKIRSLRVKSRSTVNRVAKELEATLADNVSLLEIEVAEFESAVYIGGLTTQGSRRSAEQFECVYELLESFLVSASDSIGLAIDLRSSVYELRDLSAVFRSVSERLAAALSRYIEATQSFLNWALNE